MVRLAPCTSSLSEMGESWPKSGQEKLLPQNSELIGEGVVIVGHNPPGHP